MINHHDAKEKAEFLFGRKHQLFLNFVAHTTQVKNAIIYLKNKVTDISVSIESPELHYLDVGCGYGDKTLAIINQLKTRLKVESTALDPSPSMLSIFKSTATSESIKFVRSNWEDYQPTRKFHLITSIHTFYYVNDWQKAIQKMLAHREKNGVICIAIRDTDEVCKFRDYFSNQIHGKNKPERNCNELFQLLAQLDIKYYVDFVTSQLDVRDCIALNQDGIDLLEFVLRHPYDELSYEIKNQIRDYLYQYSRGGFMPQRDGYVWIC
jgi:ubiquinone/menaquinone biosynthesis C-methylase UbiE